MTTISVGWTITNTRHVPSASLLRHICIIDLLLQYVAPSDTFKSQSINSFSLRICQQQRTYRGHDLLYRGSDHVDLQVVAGSGHVGVAAIRIYAVQDITAVDVVFVATLIILRSRMQKKTTHKQAEIPEKKAI